MLVLDEINEAMERWYIHLLNVFERQIYEYCTETCCRSLADDAILDELLELLLQSSEMIMKRANSNPLVSPRPPT